MSAAARRTVYCATKHAMEGFTKAMAIELAPHSIRVNTLGADLHRDADDRGRSSRTRRSATSVLAKIKLGRLGQVEDLTGAIVFLASDASSLMTGSALVRRRRLDGGMNGASKFNRLTDAPHDEPSIPGARLRHRPSPRCRRQLRARRPTACR